MVAFVCELFLRIFKGLRIDDKRQNGTSYNIQYRRPGTCNNRYGPCILHSVYCQASQPRIKIRSYNISRGDASDT
jgi:hypothetical protein